jgi:hypothetical protein
VNHRIAPAGRQQRRYQIVDLVRRYRRIHPDDIR